MKVDLETIHERTSIRSYDGTALTEAELGVLSESFTQSNPGPFGGRASFAVIAADSRGKVKMGTYGLIANAPAYVVGSIPKAPLANEDFGYVMEGVILGATAAGLGTCWIGGVFDRARAFAALGSNAGNLIPAVFSVGHPAERRSIADRLITRSAGSRTRKDAAQLFFDGSFDKPLVLGPGDPWTTVLEAVRSAPSASNKQPWRIIRTVSEGIAPAAFHLYLAEDKAYNSVFGDVKLQNVDMGIAMRHFEVASTELGLPGSWKRLDSHGRSVSSSAPGASVHLPRDDKGLSYIASWAS